MFSQVLQQNSGKLSLPNNNHNQVSKLCWLILELPSSCECGAGHFWGKKAGTGKYIPERQIGKLAALK